MVAVLFKFPFYLKEIAIEILLFMILDIPPISENIHCTTVMQIIYKLLFLSGHTVHAQWASSLQRPEARRQRYVKSLIPKSNFQE